MKSNTERDDIKEWLNIVKTFKEEHNKALSVRLRELLDVPRSRRPGVNLFKISKYTEEGSNIIIPGKVLSTGVLTHKVNISAIDYSAGALESINKSGSSIKPLEEMLKSKNVKILI